MLPDDLKNYSAAEQGGDSFRVLDDSDCFVILVVLFAFAAFVL